MSAVFALALLAGCTSDPVEMEYVPPAVEYAWENCLVGKLSDDKHSLRITAPGRSTDREQADDAVDGLAGAQCAVQSLNAPREVLDQLMHTPGQAGPQVARWDNKRARWTFTMVEGLDLTITDKAEP